MKTNEMNTMQNELKVCLDDKEAAKQFFDGEVGFSSEAFKSDASYYGYEIGVIQSVIDEGFKWELVSDVGGEGEGETYYKVYKFTKEDESCFVLFDGVYYSYDGATYLTWRFVLPKEKLVTVYE